TANKPNSKPRTARLTSTRRLARPERRRTSSLFATAPNAYWFLALNPAGKLPVLVDGDFVLAESVAIVLYLAEKYPQKGLLPSGLRERAEVYRWLLFTATELEAPLWRGQRHAIGYPPERRIPAEIPNVLQDFFDMARIMEKHMEGRQFLVGDHVTVADIVAAYTLDMASVGRARKELEGLPNLRAFLERMYRRPKAPARITEQFASLGR
ncbi:MAG: glutathione S-transferase family protein, partial [Myxococcales bacterium]